MRTLVVSDLHLGHRSRHDVLRWPAGRARLLEALEGVDRLVLLGDTIELVTRNRQRALAIAEPVMRDLGRRMGRDGEVIVVPGNHDAPLARAWALAQGRELRPATPVAHDASPLLERLLGWLAPARTRVSYPGVWLADGVWATHGQYLDRHLVPESAFGIRRGVLRRNGDWGAASPFDYERARRRGRDRGSGFAGRPVGAALEGLAEFVRVTVSRVPQLLMTSGLAPLTAAMIDAQMRHAAIPAMASVVRRLGVDAGWVLFGHVHRRGPVDGEPWPADGRTRFVNTGAWVYEPLLVDRARPPHPYWPGGAILLDDGHEPRSVGLLDDVAAEDLVRRPQRPQRPTR